MATGASPLPPIVFNRNMAVHLLGGKSTAAPTSANAIPPKPSHPPRPPHSETVEKGLLPAAARYASAWITGPIETLRSQAQSKTQDSVVQIYLNSVKKEGFGTATSRLYSSVIALAARDGVKGGTRFLSQAKVERYVCEIYGTPRSTEHKLALGFLSGFLGSFLVETPFTGVMDTAQMYKSSAALRISQLKALSPTPHLVAETKAYEQVLSSSSFYKLPKSMIPVSGISAPISGFSILLFRNGMFGGSMFLGLRLSEKILGACPESTLGKIGYHLASGALSAAIAVPASVPFQVIQVGVANLSLDYLR